MTNRTPTHGSRERTWRALVWAALLLSLVSFTATQPAGAVDKKTRIRELRNRLKTLGQKKAEKLDQIRVMKRAQHRLSDQLNQSYQRLETANASLKASEERLHKAELAVEGATRRAAVAEERLKQQQRRFGKRIASSYKEGPVTYTDVLTGSRNLSDFLDRQYYVSRVMARDTDLLSDLRDARTVVIQEHQRLLEQRGRLSLAHRENATFLADVAREATERETLLHAMNDERALQEQRLAELEEDSEGIHKELEGEQSRRQLNPGAYRNLPWTGRLSRPANGPITSGFGYRYHPVLRYRRLHSGVDIGAASGSPVYAAEAGEVFFASWRGGYGRCIIVLHGGGMSTLYGHLSGIDVSPGQSVARGQRIGAVGSTGLATGPHLHFEVRRNGVPVNPM